MEYKPDPKPYKKDAIIVIHPPFGVDIPIREVKLEQDYTREEFWAWLKKEQKK